MKRNFFLVSALMLALFVAACATSTTATTPDLTGTVTAIDANSITVKPATGDTTTVTVSRATRMSWYNGIDATERDVVVGHHVNIWLNQGSQNATKLVIAK